MQQHPDHVQQDGQQRATGNGADIHLAADFIHRAHFAVTLLARHQAALTGQVRVAFTELIQQAGKHNGGQTAEHHDRQNTS
ncbi:hypothetical protein D3C75_1128620 [compost metagenome]